MLKKPPETTQRKNKHEHRETTISEYGENIANAIHIYHETLKHFTNLSIEHTQKVEDALRTLILFAMHAHQEAHSAHSTAITSEEASYWGLSFNGTHTMRQPTRNASEAGKGAPNAPETVTTVDSPEANVKGSVRSNSSSTNSLVFGTHVILIRLALALVNVAASLLCHDTDTTMRLKRISQEIKAKTEVHTALMCCQLFGQFWWFLFLLFRLLEPGGVGFYGSIRFGDCYSPGQSGIWWCCRRCSTVRSQPSLLDHQDVCADSRTPP